MFIWLILLIAWPLLAAAGTALAGRNARVVALAGSLVQVGWMAGALSAFDASRAGGHQLTHTWRWIPGLGASFAIGVDGVGLLLLAMATLLVPLVILAAWREQPDGRQAARYLTLVLVLQAFISVIFAARDLFLFYVVFEAMLIPAYLLIGGYGQGVRRHYAAIKFLLFSLTGGLIMLVGMIALYFQVPAAQRGPETFLLDNLAGLPLSLGAGRLIFLSFFIAFAIKAPLFPVHTWLPDTVEAARPGTSTLLVCVLDKVGTFGMLTLCLPLFPEAARWAAPVIGWLAVFSILYGAVLAIGQRDLLRLIGYTSVSHFGFIVLGIFVFQPTATAGAALMMLNHGLSTAALFLIAGFVIARHPNGSQQIADYGGLRVAAPVLGGTFLVAVLSAAALPGLATFVSELLVIVGSFPANRPAALVSILAVALAALYALWTYQRIFTGSPARWAGSGAALDESALGGGQGRGVAGPPAAVAPADLVARERVVAGVLIAALVLLGAVPQLGLRYVDAPATQVANSVTEVAS